MHERLQCHPVRDAFGNAAHLLERQFARQHHLLESRAGKEGHLLRRTVIHLRTRVQRDRRDVEPRDAHVLHNECIHPRVVQLADHLLSFLQLVVAQDGVQGNVDRHIIYMGEIAERADVVDRVTGRGACSKLGCADIDGVSAVQHGLPAARQILSRSQQLNVLLHLDLGQRSPK